MDGFYSIPEVAAKLGLHRSTIKRWIEEGTLDFITLRECGERRTIRIPESAVDYNNDTIIRAKERTCNMDGLYSITEVAAKLGLHRNTIKRWIEEGTLEFITLREGKRRTIRIPESAVDYNNDKES